MSGITHTFVSAQPDGGDATLLQPSEWNAGHTVALSAGDIPDLSAVYDVAGLAAAAQAASDPSGSATTALVTAKAYTDSSVTGLMTQAQVLARGFCGS